MCKVSITAKDMTAFLNLPTEIQLQVLDKLPSRSLLDVLCTSGFLNSIASSAIESKLGNLIANQEFFISLYSPQLHHHLAETFSTVCLSNPASLVNTPKYSSENESLVDLDQVCTKLSESKNKPHPLLLQSLHNSLQPMNGTYFKTLFQLGSLKSTYNPLDLAKTENTSVSNQDDGNNLLLLVNEDEPYIKFHVELKFKYRDAYKSIIKFNTRLDPKANSGTINSEDNTMTLDYKLTKGEEVSPRSPYDFEVFHHYNLEVDNVQINSLYLLHQVDF